MKTSIRITTAQVGDSVRRQHPKKHGFSNSVSYKSNSPKHTKTTNIEPLKKIKIYV